MVRVSITYLVQVILFYGAHQLQARLPQYVFRVDSCPCPNNISKWQDASERLHCLHNLNSTDSGNVYHCLPSIFLNETVEFCGKGRPIPPGYCPIYDYKVNADDIPDLYNCTAFISGCPTQNYSSQGVRIYLSCLKIIPKSQCYEKERTCQEAPDLSTSPTVSTPDIPDPDQKFKSTIPTNSSSDIPESDDKVKYVYVIIVVVLFLIGILFLLYKRHVLNQEGEETINVIGHALNQEGEETLPMLETTNIGATNRMEQYNNFLRSLANSMTANIFKRIKCFVRDREEVNYKDLKEMKKPKDLLDYLDEKYFVYNNVIYLQGLFLSCKAPELYDQCVEYAKKRGEEIPNFEKRVLEKDHTKVKYIINCLGVSEYQRSELEKLRLMLATLIHANYDDIFVSGVKTGCVIVTMMIRNCLIPTLKALYTPEKLTLTCHWMLKLSLKYKIVKVMIQDEVIYPPDTLQTVDELTAKASLSSHALRSISNSETEIPKTNDLDRNIPNAVECKEQSTSCEESVLSKVSDKMLTKNISFESNDFTIFLERIGNNITDDTWHSMKLHLCEFVDHKRVEKMNPAKMLNELSDMLKLQYNMSFLEWMFKKCGKPELVRDCQQYSAKNQFQLECFNTNFPPSCESQPFEIQFMVLELESYRDELQDLRYWLAKTIHVHPGQLLMTVLKNGPIVVTFLMRENHGNAILEYLKTDDGQIAASHKRIEKIVQKGNVIKIGKALNGSTFVQIRLCLRGNSFGIQESVRNLASIFFRRTGITMEGNEIYTRTVPSDRKGNETKAKPIEEESFIEKNRTFILENIEPLTIEHTDIAELFNREALAGMEDITGRRDRAEYFLKLCHELPKENREIACAYLEGIVSLPKEKPTYNEELSPLKKRIQQIREDLLDEIDSEFIKSTIYQLEDVPEEVKTSWSDPNKSRTEKAQIFLDFALQKDEYVKALTKTMEEFGIQFTE